MSQALEPLWKIDETLLALMDSIEYCPDDLRPELQAEIELYLGKEAAKVDQTAHVLAALEYEEKAASDEMARLAERKRLAKASRDRLESYLCRIITARGGKPLKGDTNILSVRTSDAVVITDEAAVPAKFIVEKTIVTKTPDKTLIKKAMKAGEDIPGVDLEFRSNLQRR
jgi:hypothetical protein